MKKLILLIALCTMIVSCGPHYEEGEMVRRDREGYPVFYLTSVEGMDIYCNPECPPKEDLIHKVNQVKEKFSAHLTKREVRRATKGAEILFTSAPIYFGDREVQGITHTVTKQVWIDYEHKCKPKGLCDGVFVYELGHLYMNVLDPEGTEEEWLEFRKETDLITTYNPEEVTEPSEDKSEI